MKIVKRIIISSIFCISSFIVEMCCYGQTTTDFYNKQNTLIELKQSILNEIDLDSERKDIDTRNFRILINHYFDSARFSQALDSLSFYDKGNFTNYYIIVYFFSGEMTIIKVIIRGYSRNQGKEVVYHLAPSCERKIIVNEYTYNKHIFNSVYKGIKPINGNYLQTGDLFSISIFRKGCFKTKIFKANQLASGYLEMIEALFGQDM